MNMEEKLRHVVDKATADVQKWHEIIHGNDTVEVETENGNVPTVAKQLRDIREEVISGLSDVVTEVISARDETLLLKESTSALKNEAEKVISTIDAQVLRATSAAAEASSYAYDMSVRVQSLYQEIKTIETQKILLEDEISLYQKEILGEISLKFEMSSLSKKNKVITFELLLKKKSGANVVFEENIIWLNEDIPEISELKDYLFVFRSFDNGANWLGNLQGSW